MLCLAALFVGTYKLFTLHDDGPIWYHPDEPSKVWQLIAAPTPEDPWAGRRNYRHPQLLLEATERWVRHYDTPRDSQAVVEAGRHVSGIFAATCALSLTAAGYLAFGFAGLFITGAAMCLCPSLLVYAHYMKEDAALACGVGAVVGASALYWRSAPSVFGWLITLPLLGVAAALAPSGKYVGLFSLACAIPTVLLAPGQRWWTSLARLITFALAFVLAISLINHRVFDNYQSFRANFEMEKEHGMTGHGDVSMDAPNTFILHVVRVESSWPVIILAGLAIPILATRLIRRGRGAWYRRNGWQLCVAFFAIVVFATLSMSRIPFNRYALPAVVMTHFLAAISAANIARWIGQLVRSIRSRRASLRLMRSDARHNDARPSEPLKLSLRDRLATWSAFALPSLAMIAMFAGTEAPACASLNEGFLNDSRQLMRQWVNDHVPAGTAIVCDRYTMLTPRVPIDRRSSFGQDELKVRVVDAYGSEFWGPESIDSLKRRGVKYIAISDAAYERYTLPMTHGLPGEEEQFNHRRAFYETLFRDYPLAWHYNPHWRNGAFNSPELRIYKIGD